MGIRPFNDLAIEFQHEPQHTPCAAGCCGPKLVVKFRSAPSCQQRNGKANEPGLRGAEACVSHFTPSGT